MPAGRVIRVLFFRFFNLKPTKMKHENITNLIIKAFYQVYNTVGYGFLEKVYENAMRIELMQTGLFVEQKKRINVYYKAQRLETIMQILKSIIPLS